MKTIINRLIKHLFRIKRKEVNRLLKKKVIPK